MKFFKVHLLLILLTLFSCGVKQPVENTGTNEKTGQVFVTTDPVQGAAIILDGVATGLTTPDTIKNVLPGKHIIRVFLDGYRANQDSFAVDVKADEIAVVSFQLQKIITAVTLRIDSDPPGAAILLDNQNTGKQTPDTLTVIPGDHSLQLIKNGFTIKDTAFTAEQEEVNVHLKLPVKQRVLFESFANVSCVPCVAATENMLKFTEEQKEDNYIVLEYFANWPSPNDPFYKTAPKDVDQRVTFYNVQTLPTLKLRGTTGVDPNNYDEMVSKYQQAIAAQNSSIGISIDKQLNDNQMTVKVEIFDYNSETSNSDLRLFVAISEDSIHFDSPPGSNGIKDFEWVFRGFLSDRQGDVIDKMTFEYSIDWPASWQYRNSKIIAFIQNIQNKQVLQTGVN